MSVKGFKLSDGTVVKYDYSSLDNIVTDSTLSVDGVAADAGAVGDELLSLQNKSFDLDELDRLKLTGLSGTAGQTTDKIAQLTTAIGTEASARMAADAELVSDIAVERARITNLASLASGSTTGDAELADIRVGDDGVTYSSAGDAVRGQFSDVKDDMKVLVGNDYYLEDTISGYTLVRGYWDSSGWHSGSTNTISISSMQTASDDLLVTTDDSSVYRFSIFVYDSTGTSLIVNSWYNADAIPILKGTKFAFATRYADTRTLTDDLIADLTNHIHINKILYKENASLFIKGTSVDGKVLFGNNTGRYVNIIRWYANEDTIVGLKDYTTDVYSLFFWDSDTGYITHSYYSANHDLYVKKGIWYTIITDVPSNIKRASVEQTIINEVLSSMYGMSIDIANVRNRLIKLESTNMLPSYYDDYIQNKCSTINSLKPTNGTQFVFITDQHINIGTPSLHSKSLINYISRHTFVDTIVCGGDMANGNVDAPSFSQVIRDGYEYINPDNNWNVMFVAGNHDTGIDYDNNVATPKLISDNILSKNTLPIIRNLSNLTYDTQNRLNYFVDNSADKIRFIISSAELKGYDSAIDEGYNDEYIWLCNALDSTPNGYTIIVFNHVVFTNPSDANPTSFVSDLLTVCDCYNAREASPMYGSNAASVFDFSNAGGTVACWIAGHLHMDRSTTSDGGIPVILTTTDNGSVKAESDNTNRTTGTVNEQAFDVFSIDTTNKTINATRIGGGLDRSFTY